MSLSQEPAYSTLKNYFVCGWRDITGQPWAGMSGVHDNFGNAVHTSNGAGPHNIQMFILSADGTVLTCLPGYWSPEDLVTEMRFAAQLNKVWTNQSLSRTQKDQIFSKMHMAHVALHSPQMHNRSHLQGFDIAWEVKHNLANTDIIKNKSAFLASYNPEGGSSKPMGGGWGGDAYKTADVLMHERMARRPFEQYDHFDVASFSDYGQPKYDKQEDARLANGDIDHEKAAHAPTLGKDMRAAKANGDVPDKNAWGNAGWGSH